MQIRVDDARLSVRHLGRETGSFALSDIESVTRVRRLSGGGAELKFAGARPFRLPETLLGWEWLANQLEIRATSKTFE